MNRTRLWSLTLGLALVPALFTMHLRLVKCFPERNTLATAPTTEVRLWFNQKPEIGLSAITLVRSDSTVIPTAKVAATEDSLSFKAALRDTLQPGSYEVRWKAVAADGHVVRGSYSFQQQ